MRNPKIFINNPLIKQHISKLGQRRNYKGNYTVFGYALLLIYSDQNTWYTVKQCLEGELYFLIPVLENKKELKS